jgi:hypothetical protein
MKTIVLILSLLIAGSLLGQQQETIVVYAEVVGNDTIPIVELNEVDIMTFRIIESKREYKRLTKLIRNVKKVYPYAKLAGIKLNQYEEILLNASSDKERKQILKQAEKEIQAEYGNDLKNLTFSQGKILIKLVDRETGNSSYELVKELRGAFRAFFYQTFAKIFGYNLKVKYDPYGEDADIEFIVRMIETGQI